MKAIFVVVFLVLLCGCFAAKIKIPKNPFHKNQQDILQKKLSGRGMPAKSVDEGGRIELLPFPCSLTVKYRLYEKWYLGNRTGKFKKYYYSYCDTYTEEGTDAKFTEVVRADIQQKGNPLSALYVMTEEEGDQCEKDIDYIDNYIENDESMVSVVLLEELAYDVAKETTWQGKKCMNYTQIHYDDSYTSFFVVEDRVIGMEDSSSNYIVIDEFKFEDVREDIVVPKNCKDDEIPEAAYSEPPKIDACKSEFKKTEMNKPPCTYSLKLVVNETDSGSSSVSEREYRMYGKNLLELSSDDDYTYAEYTRADIVDPDTNCHLVVKTMSDESECIVYDQSYECDEDDEDEELFAPVIYCLTKEDATWKGEKCTNCTSFKEGMFVFYYFKDDYPLAVSSGVNDLYTMEISFKFTFENFREDMALNASCVNSFDPIPEKAYSAPDEIKDCSSKPPKKDASSTISVVASMVVSMVMITLISLF